MKLTEPLPPSSFAELAVEVGIVARREEHSIDNLELQARAMDRAGQEIVAAEEGGSGYAVPDVERMRRLCEFTIKETRITAERLADAQTLLRLLAPHEEQVRELISSLTRGAAA